VKLNVEVEGTVQYCIPEMRLRLLGYEEYPDRDVGAVVVDPFRVVNVNELYIVKLNVDEYSVPLVIVTLVVGIEAPLRALIIIPEDDGIHITPEIVG
jgi:hypothetical protein